MKRILMIFVGLYTATLVVACQNNRGNDDVVQPPPQVGCPPGTYFNNGYCYTNQHQIVATNSVGYNSGFNIGRNNMRITNSSIYRLFLREAFAICDRDAYNSGLSSCDSYLNGYARLTLQAIKPEPEAIRLTMEVAPTRSVYGWHNISAPNGGQMATCGLTYLVFGTCLMYYTPSQMTVPRNPLVLDMQKDPINNYQGFEGRSFGQRGTPAQNKWVQFQVDVGTLNDGYFDYKLSYNGQANATFAEGRMLRCGGEAGATCGLW